MIPRQGCDTVGSSHVPGPLVAAPSHPISWTAITQPLMRAARPGCPAWAISCASDPFQSLKKVIFLIPSLSPNRLLIAEIETPEARERRRANVGRSSGETYKDTLRTISPGAVCDLIRPAEDGAELPDPAGLQAYDAVFLTGSPLHLYQDTPAVRRQLDFMRAVFASGTPSFGSCAGLQVATVAAGGRVRENRRGHEVAFARRITPTEAGLGHGLLAGRPAAYDALTMHSDEVERLPEHGTLLATNGVTMVQAAEIQHDGGVF